MISIHSSGEQRIPTEWRQKGEGVYVGTSMRIECLHAVVCGHEFTIPFSTRYYPERYILKARGDGGYSMSLGMNKETEG